MRQNNLSKNVSIRARSCVNPLVYTLHNIKPYRDIALFQKMCTVEISHVKTFLNIAFAHQRLET